MPATAEAAFRLIDQASDPIKKIRSAAVQMDEALQKAGKSLDNLDSTRNTTSVRNIERQVSSFGRTTEDAGRKVERSTDASGRAFERMRDKGVKSIETLTVAIKQFEHERATAVLDVDIAKAEAKIRLLKHELRTLTTQQAQKELGDLGLVTANLAATMSGGAAGNGPPGGGPGLRAALGGVSGGMGIMMAAVIALAPAVVALSGAVSALVGSLGAAVGGVGAVGVGTLGAFAVGIGSLIGVIKPAITQLGEVKKAQQTYNKAVEQYGDKSAQAVAAHKKMLAAFKDAPGAADVLQNAQVLSSRWKSQTAPGRASFFGMLNDSLRTTNALLPTFSSIANRAMAAVRRGVNNLLEPFRSGEWRSIFRVLGDTFARIAEGPGSKAFANFALWFGRVARAASPITVRAFEALNRWTSGLADRASDSARVERTIERWVGHLKAWVGLTGAAMRLLGAFFGAGATQGKSVVESITDQFDRWTAWIHEHPAEIQDFFRRTIESAGKLTDAIGHIVAAIGKIADALIPVLNGFSDLVSLMGGGDMLGPLALLGGAKLLGGGKLMSGLFGRGAAGAAGAAAGGRAAAGGAAVTGGLMSRARGLPETFRNTRDLYRYNLAMEGSRGAAASGLLRGGAGRLGMTALRGVGKIALPLTAALAAFDFATAGGSVMHRTGAAVNGAMFGIPEAVGLWGQDNPQKAKVQGNDAASKWFGEGKSSKQVQRHINQLYQQASGVHQKSVTGMAGTSTKWESTLSQQDRRKIYAQIEALRPVLKVQLETEGKNKAIKALDDIQQAYDIRLGAKAARRNAGRNVISDVASQLRRVGPEGRDELLKGTAAWTAILGDGTARQKRLAKQLRTYIVEQYKSLGQNVAVVNGRILTGTRTEWLGIRDAMAGAAEQALQEVSRHFTALQREAVGALTLMGFTPRQAKAIVQTQETLNQSGLSAKGATDVARGAGAAGARYEGLAKEYSGKKRARGGRVPGVGTSDSVPYGPYHVAPGELVVNQHTEQKVDQRLGFPGALGMLVNGEHTPHGLRTNRAYGGAVNRAPGLTPQMGALIRQLDGMGFRHGSTTGGKHASGSYHYRGMAVDYGSASNDLTRLWSVVSPMRGQFAELFGPPGLFKHGTPFKNATLQAQHMDHIHMALTQAMGALGGGAAGGGAFKALRLKRPRSRLGGVPGALSNRAAAVMAGALEQRVNQNLGGADLGAGVSGNNQSMARQMMLQMGWPASEWGALKSLWTGESGFSETARNPSSGAYGIPQALPPSKMGPAAQGAGPAAAKAQIGWGLRYIRQRYSSPSNAFAQWTARSPHWYATGGRIPQAPEFGGWFGQGGSFTAHRPTLIGVGDRGAERVTVTRASERHGGVNLTVNIGRIDYRQKGDIKKVVQEELAEVARDLFRGDDEGEF